MLCTDPAEDLKGHKGPVTSVRYNATGEYCLTSGDDKSIILWNAAKNIKLKSYLAHGQAVHDVHASHDNFHLGSCSADRTVFYWDVASGSVLRRFRGHNTIVNCVKFNNDSSVLMSGGNDSMVRLMDLKSRSYEPIQVLDDAKDSVTCIDCTNDEVLVGSVDGKVRTYDLRMGKLKEDYLGQPISSVRFSNDGQSLLTSTSDNIIRLLDKTTGELLNDFTGHKHSSLHLASSLYYDDSCVIGCSEDNKVFVWDLITAKQKQVLEMPALTQRLSAHPSRYEVLCAGFDGSVRVWRGEVREEEEEKEGEKSMSCWALPPR